MPYLIANEEFRTKELLTKRCREILESTPNGACVADIHLPFLFALFRFHDEWDTKSSCGIQSVATQTTEYGTRCFALQRTDGSMIDISFPHAIKLIPTTRKKDLLPQGLTDYRNAARTAVTTEIRSFRDKCLATNSTCPILGINITRETSDVDHVAPLTFDRLLFDFTLKSSINPLMVAVGSRNGTVPIFEDRQLNDDWVGYHNENAELRLVSRTGHSQLSTERVDWSIILQTA
ncbi:DUF3223 domain-containing protein [Anabaena catenula]|uniref:DUF3223 domain-containing protein n=1 Tax=Anabaena catenula FACHB-362 TaxID=2692877 RepID=A0ABR8J264_9NOST|nr:DUF3223 domain-containing protein [Anabaena catenula]MBD2691276.1 DUF3223 domain-containing protein [Anabaena catenula FACHB-362]